MSIRSISTTSWTRPYPCILAQLDPHSTYISAEDVQKVNSELKGSFSGVGIEFTIQRDTINVGNVIKGGPAEKMGLLAGDKIVEVDGKPFVGQVVTDTEARRRLMGPKGTKVEVGVVRYGTKAVKRFTITRADIVTPSIAATYMLNDSTGYIRIKSFGRRPTWRCWPRWPRSRNRASRASSSTCATTTAATLRAPYRWPTSFCPRTVSSSIRRAARVPAATTAAAGAAPIRPSRWSSSSTRPRPPRPRSSPVPSRTTTAAPSSAADPSARASCSSRSDSPTAARSASPSPATTRPRAAAYRSPTSSATRPTTTRTSSSATSGASSSPATASTIRVPPTTPRSDVPSMAVAASRPTSSWPRTRPTSPPTTSRPS